MSLPLSSTVHRYALLLPVTLSALLPLQKLSMASSQLPSFEFVSRLLHRVPQQHRSVYLKALFIAICLLRSKIFVVARPGIFQRQQKIKSSESEVDVSHSELRETKPEQLVPVYTVDDDGSDSVFVPFRGRLSKVSTNFVRQN